MNSNVPLQSVIDSLASIAESDAQIIRSSNGRHVASGNVVGKPTANRVSLSDGEKRPKAVQDAFKRNAALTTLSDACADFGSAVASARAILVDAAKKADAARRAVKTESVAK